MIRDADPQRLRSIMGRNIRFRRIELDISQEELAQAMGTSASNLSGIERGRRNTTVDQVEKIAKALKIDPSELLVDRKIATRISTDD
jgi:transcriptional regulator with XRE-family HTH domain